MSPESMRAARLGAPRSLTVEDLPLPRPGPGEALVEVRAVGLCGTDVMVYQGRYPARLPVVPGHEYAGVVAALGEGVDGWSPGQPVLSQASWGCGECAACRGGHPAGCAHRRALGRTVDGALAQYVRVPAASLLPLPEGLSFLDGQAMIALACALRALSRARPEREEGVLIIGSGHAGLILSQVYGRLAGAGVTLAGTRPERLALALRLGARAALSVREEGWRERARELSGGEGYPLVVEASGSRAAFSDALELVGDRGSILLFSLYGEPLELPPDLAYRRELTLLGSRGGQGFYQEAIELLSRGEVDVRSLITHRLPLERTAEGFELMDKKVPGAFRVVVEPATGSGR